MQLNLNAQTNYSKTVNKKDGRFISGRLDASEFSIKSKDRTGLVEEVHINIELWSLLQEPVEKYLFRWKRGSSVQASDYTTLSESVLSKYPDLLKRYRALKPEYVGLKYFVSTELKPEYINQENLEACGKKFINNLKVTNNASWGSNGGATGYRNINSSGHFLIVKSGETGNDLVPGSPKDWINFIQWGDCSGINNKKAYNTFKYAAKMTFYNLELTELKVPIQEIDAIAKEFIKREENKDVSENKSQEDTKSNDDFLAAEASASGDDFLKEDSKSKDDDFLSEDKDDDSFLSDDKKKADDFKIDTKDGKTGVINSKGRILIPYRDWSIIEFKDGVAKISYYFDKFECNGKTKAYAYKTGYVDSSGDFLDGFKITFMQFKEQQAGGYIKIKRVDAQGNEIKHRMSAAEKAKRDRKKREKERCKRETENWIEQLKIRYNK
ncbi:MAG: hypothetical protein C0598_03625 [Marinilabiliales bacterium]|nr:MAG: hypothetical protein C0598_03625 [Marinilabiliales bacterium]